MRTARLVEFYEELPEPQEAEEPGTWAGRLQNALEEFQDQVAEHYTEGTLQRLLTSSDPAMRRAAVLALGLLGSMRSNALVAACLHDGDRTVRQLAADGIWSLWFRADTDAHNQELQRVMRVRDVKKALAGFQALIQKASSFAEAFNQRAILYFRTGDLHKAIADCEKVLKLNPYHFGAQAGMGQCYLRLRKPRPALKAFREALRINPNMEGVQDAIRALEETLGEEGRKNEER